MRPLMTIRFRNCEEGRAALADEVKANWRYRRYIVRYPTLPTLTRDATAPAGIEASVYPAFPKILRLRK